MTMTRTDEQLKRLVQDHLSEDGGELDLNWQGLDDDDLRRLVPLLEGLTGLQGLDLSGCTGLTDLAPVAGLTGLQGLDLSGCTGLTDIGVSALRSALPGCAVYV